MRWNMKTSKTTATSNLLKNNNQAKYYFCYCPIFDFWAFGRTKEEAWRMLKEDLFLLLMKCSCHESKDKVFREYSYSSAEIRA
jgi:predicted RNase H-like HicB family nuclease